MLVPFPFASLDLVWEWMNEDHAANFDDYGPKTFEEFTSVMMTRAITEALCGVLDNEGNLCGIVAYLPMTPRLGTFRGICFASRVHGSGIPRQAVREMLKNLFDSGVEKVSASFFSDNVRVQKFLRRMGAKQEGLLRKHTLRDGKETDMMVMAIFAKEFRCH